MIVVNKETKVPIHHHSSAAHTTAACSVCLHVLGAIHKGRPQNFAIFTPRRKIWPFAGIVDKRPHLPTPLVRTFFMEHPL